MVQPYGISWSNWAQLYITSINNNYIMALQLSQSGSAVLTLIAGDGECTLTSGVPAQDLL
jgi:hypothetical protein